MYKRQNLCNVVVWACHLKPVLAGLTELKFDFAESVMSSNEGLMLNWHALIDLDNWEPCVEHCVRNWYKNCVTRMTDNLSWQAERKLGEFVNKQKK